MPQHGHKKPFSTKQKKKQLQMKREKKKGHDEHGFEESKIVERHRSASRERSSEETSLQHASLSKLNQQPTNSGDKRYDPNRYRLHFQSETKEELARRKEQARAALTTVSETELEVSIDEVYRPGSMLDLPKRPPWDYNMSREKLLMREEKYFREYLENLLEKHGSEDLSYLELNLETWRQLWRVVEMSDIVLLIADIRHPALHFSPALYEYVTKQLKKFMILVLNKIDLAPPALVVAWKNYFKQKYPEVHIVMFTSFPKDSASSEDVDPEKVLHKRKRRRRVTPVGPRELYEACESIVQGKVNLSSWEEKIEEDLSSSEASAEADHEFHSEDTDSSFVSHEQFKDGILTVGCCGYPNVGKSSLMNALVGKKVVSVSRTPGHTKHFQTIFLTKSVKLCDSPGLVFPSLIPRAMQVLAGIYPIAQVREPYTAVAFLAQRLDIPKLLRLSHPDPEDGAGEWSAMDVCEAWALKRGFLTAKAGRPDVYRAANNLLRLSVDGRLCLCMRPPNYTAQKADWQLHPETSEIAKIQQQCKDEEQHSQSEEFSDTDSESKAESQTEGSQDSESNETITKNPFSLLADDD